MAKGVVRIWSQGISMLATENLVPGHRVYNERLIVKKGTEYRTWDPYRSKLAAALLNGLETLPLKPGSSVLYLGASTGTTASHISDIVGNSGTVFAVEHTSRVARELLDRVASNRNNIVPIIQDARRPDNYFGVFGKVDLAYCDIAQPDQTKIAIANCDAHLKDGGSLLLVIKSRSIDAVLEPRLVAEREIAKLEKFDVIQAIDLEPYDKDHAMVHARYEPSSL